MIEEGTSLSFTKSVIFAPISKDNNRTENYRYGQIPEKTKHVAEFFVEG
jgi:hypothetical protein